MYPNLVGYECAYNFIMSNIERKKATLLRGRDKFSFQQHTCRKETSRVIRLMGEREKCSIPVGKVIRLYEIRVTKWSANLRKPKTTSWREELRVQL